MSSDDTMMTSTDSIATDQNVTENGQQGTPSTQLKAPDRKVGLKQWSNNQSLSDIELRYGPNHEHVFYGHKVVLASSSLWFKNAFTRPEWAESSSPSITLEDDDPEHLTSMLEACYHPTHKYSIHVRTGAMDTPPSITIFHIGMYKVADKYDVAELRKVAARKTVNSLNRAMTRFEDNLSTFTDVHAAIRGVGLFEILKEAYDVVGHKESTDYLRTKLLDLIMKHGATCILGLEPGRLHAELRKATKEIPEFGSDMFLGTLDTAQTWREKPECISPAFLGFMELVTCPTCHEMWEKNASVEYGHCVHCGAGHQYK
jgi:hypothetical protein